MGKSHLFFVFVHLDFDIFRGFRHDEHTLTLLYQQHTYSVWGGAENTKSAQKVYKRQTR